MPPRTPTAAAKKSASDDLEAWTAALGRAMSHPTRMDILQRLTREGTLSPSEAATATSISLATTAYHMGALRTIGLVKPARTRPVRGAVEHFYELTDLGHAAVRAIEAALALAPERAD